MGSGRGVGLVSFLLICLIGHGARGQGGGPLCGVDSELINGPAHGVRTELGPDGAPAFGGWRGPAAGEWLAQQPPPRSELASPAWLSDVVATLDLAPPGAAVTIVVVDHFAAGGAAPEHGDYVVELLGRVLDGVGAPWEPAVTVTTVNYWPELTTRAIADKLGTALDSLGAARVVVLLDFEILPCELLLSESLPLPDVDLRALAVEDQNLLDVLLEASGDRKLVAAALQHVADEAAEVAAAYSDDGNPDPLALLIRRAMNWSLELVVIAPAGNRGGAEPSAPGVLQDVVSVSANIDGVPSDVDWEYPNAVFPSPARETSSKGEVMAPGGWYALGDLNLNGLVDHVAGTSLAAPVVSALAAVYLSAGHDAGSIVARLRYCHATGGYGYWHLPSVLSRTC